MEDLEITEAKNGASRGARGMREFERSTVQDEGARSTLGLRELCVLRPSSVLKRLAFHDAGTRPEQADFGTDTSRQNQ